VTDLGLEEQVRGLKVVVSTSLEPPWSDTPVLVLGRRGCQFLPEIMDWDSYLGAYFPDSSTLVVPENASEATILHEIGHHWAFTAAGDLSEAPANAFMNYYRKYL